MIAGRKALSRRNSNSLFATSSALALLALTGIGGSALAQTVQEAPKTTPLPPLDVQAGAPAKKAAKPAAAPTPAAQTSSAPAEPVANAKGDVGYLATKSTSATKTDTPLRNIPQSVAVVTEQQIKDQSFQSIGDITRYVPGIILHQGEGNRDQVSIRGQVASTADFFRDGIRDDAQVFRDLYNAERVEFLKGPAALIFGRGGAGGVVNIVSKQPEFRPAFGSATVEYGSYNHKRSVFDAGSTVGSGSAFRITGMIEDSGSYRNFVDMSRWAINPTFAFKLSDQTKITLGYEHAYDHRTADRGIPSMGGIPSPADRSTYFGKPDQSYAQSTVDRVYAIVDHKFDSAFSVRNHTSFVHYDKFYQNIFPSTSVGVQGPGLVGISNYNNETNRENLFNQTDFTYKFGEGLFRHTLMFGGEIGQQTSNNWRRVGTFDGPGNGDCKSFGAANGLSRGQCNVLFSSPTIFSPNVNFSTTASRSLVEANVASAYVQDQIQITRYFEVVAGIRHDTFKVDFTNRGPATATLPANAQLSQTDNLLSPRLGLIVKQTEMLSLYGSYAVSYLPSTGDQFASIGTNTLTLEPEKYTNYEIGAKWDITKRLSFTSALYRTDRENVRFATSPTTFVQTGTSQVEGLEVSLAGYVTRAWQMSAGFNHIFSGALTSATATATTAVLPVGTPLPLLPRDTFSLWNRYQFTEMFGAGVGLVYHASNIATLQPESNRVTLPAYTTVDAALYFKFNENLSAQVNVNNVFNQGYILSADSNDNLTPGAPTTVLVSVTSKF